MSEESTGDTKSHVGPTLYTFKITYPSGLVREETVMECDTVDKFKMQHFGSVDPDEFGVTVELVAIDGQAPPTEAAQPPAAAPAAPVPTPAAAVAPAPVAKAAGSLKKK